MTLSVDLYVTGSTLSISGTSSGIFHAAVPSRFSAGLSGSLTQLVTGQSYLAAGANVTITSSSNGQVLITAVTGSGTAPTSGVGLARVSGSAFVNPAGPIDMFSGSSGFHALYGPTSGSFVLCADMSGSTANAPYISLRGDLGSKIIYYVGGSHIFANTNDSVRLSITDDTVGGSTLAVDTAANLTIANGFNTNTVFASGSTVTYAADAYWMGSGSFNSIGAGSQALAQFVSGGGAGVASVAFFDRLVPSGSILRLDAVVLTKEVASGSAASWTLSVAYARAVGGSAASAWSLDKTAKGTSSNTPPSGWDATVRLVSTNNVRLEVTSSTTATSCVNAQWTILRTTT